MAVAVRTVLLVEVHLVMRELTPTAEATSPSVSAVTDATLKSIDCHHESTFLADPSRREASNAWLQMARLFCEEHPHPSYQLAPYDNTVSAASLKTVCVQLKVCLGAKR